MRQQYHGSLPLISIENFVEKLEQFQLKSDHLNEKLNEVNDLQSNLMTKHSVYNQMLDLSSTKCIENSCKHKMKNIISVRKFHFYYLTIRKKIHFHYLTIRKKITVAVQNIK